MAIQVQQASNVEAAATALERATDDIWRLTSLRWVSPVSRAGTGPFIMLDAGESPDWDLLDRIPLAIVARLEEAGVTDAVVDRPEFDGKLRDLDFKVPRAVTLVAFPPARAQDDPLPDAWLAEAAAWVSADLGAGDDIDARLAVVMFPVPVSEALDALRRANAGKEELDLAAGDRDGRLRRAMVSRNNITPRVTMSAGGPECSDDEMVGLVQSLTEVARRLAPEAVYAAVGIDPVFTDGRIFTDYWRHHGGMFNQSVERHFRDDYVIDAFPYQVLSPGHIARLGTRPPGSEPLPGGRFGLAIGDPADWLLGPPANEFQHHLNVCARRRDPNIQERGREMLRACMLREGDTPIRKAQ